MPNHFAHSTERADGSDWQTLRDHLLQFAVLSRERGQKFGMERAAKIAGLLHDLGKYTPGFQARLNGGAAVDHASAGAQELRRIHAGSPDALMAEIIGYAIAGHHAGLPDQRGDGGLSERLEKPLEANDPIWQKNAGSLSLPPGWLKKGKAAFQLAMLGRMIFSCLVDSGYRDTEAFYDRISGQAADHDWPMLRTVVECPIAPLMMQVPQLVNAAVSDRPFSGCGLNERPWSTTQSEHACSLSRPPLP